MTKENEFFINNIGSQNSTINLTSPTTMPNSNGFLWNKKMMVQVNCRGYVNAQFMQPEPSKYSHGPNLEAKTFIQPEHHYFAHHPGRFFYIKDIDNGHYFSAPYEPTRKPLDKFIFKLGNNEISWHIECLQLNVELTLSLTEHHAVERWSIKLTNLGSNKRNIAIYPYFSIGYMSWMNQSASFDKTLNAVVANSITPYQKVDDYFKNKALKDKTFLAASISPSAFSANQDDFEGEGGLHSPAGIHNEKLSNTDACYETPAAVMQFDATFEANEAKSIHFLFGPAHDNQEIQSLITDYLTPSKFAATQQDYNDYVAQGKGCLTLTTGDELFDDFVNHWLPRQIFYHGDVNRLSTDPQTRNYLQDGLGMNYLNTDISRQTLTKALSQQQINGAMPDGILLHPDAELKYINQVPHVDHCVWLPICLKAYIDETADFTLLTQKLPFKDSDKLLTVSTHIEMALNYLIQATDNRHLSFIEQGDWCDPMNMVGYQGKGVSSWLSLATVYAINTWCELCEKLSAQKLPDFFQQTTIQTLRQQAKVISDAVNEHLWDGQWYARGITDDNTLFGVNADDEGRIFLNPQSWAILAETADSKKKNYMYQQIEQQLMTPFGVMMLAPSYTKMREDIGRITQKSPGVAENGSVYNHAGIFYAYSLFRDNQADKAFDVLKKMLPSSHNSHDVQQLPSFIPNYYRGAYYQYPNHAGRSSQLFNTGTIAWFYRCLVEEFCGLKGDINGLTIAHKLPAHLPSIKGKRHFRGAYFEFSINQSSSINKIEIICNGEKIQGSLISNIIKGQQYQLTIRVPIKKA